MDQQAEKDKTERVIGLGRKTREEIGKWNQMTALRFQTGGRHQTSLASLQGEFETKKYFCCIDTEQQYKASKREVCLGQAAALFGFHFKTKGFNFWEWSFTT